MVNCGNSPNGLRRGLDSINVIVGDGGFGSDGGGNTILTVTGCFHFLVALL